MTLLKPGTWAFGTFDERRNDGGWPVRLLADSVLPYTTPASLPDWWQSGKEGQFEGARRNFADFVGTTVPNFPAERYLNVVMPFMLGTHQGATAPLRIMEDQMENQSDLMWPWAAQSGTPAPTALELLTYYVLNYLDPATKLIVQIPERDVMNYIATTGTLTRTLGHAPTIAPDFSEGEAGIAELLFGLLRNPDPMNPSNPDQGLGLASRIVAWKLLDEPDLKHRNLWATPGNLRRLRDYIRERELAVRTLNSDPEFAGLTTDAERRKRLRPCMITLSSFAGGLQGNPPAPLIPPANFRTATTFVADDLRFVDQGPADIFFYDWYPFRRTIPELASDYRGINYGSACTLDPDLTDAEEPGLTPDRSIQAFESVWRGLNEGGATRRPGGTKYLYVGLWSQTAGSPLRETIVSGSNTDVPTPASPKLPPTLMPRRLCGEAPSFTRKKRFPTVDEMRFYAWAGVFAWAEGIAGFNQQGAADDLLLSRFIPVIEEFEYFERIRVASVNRNGEISRVHYDPVSPDKDAPIRRPIAYYFDYPDAPFLPSVDDSPLTWLILVNREGRRHRGLITFPTPGPFGFALEEIKLLLPQGGLVPITPARPVFDFDLMPYQVQIFWQRPLTQVGGGSGDGGLGPFGF